MISHFLNTWNLWDNISNKHVRSWSSKRGRALKHQFKLGEQLGKLMFLPSQAW
ncbi:hypothetical protein RchiOBHm_Chr2g0175261 [Rosa chinensis]|uniref:Uncharacterized protein n=1 Tax=Rosa chinensis TaxID=74649 RepID=A0A2P6S6D1_ROSCH|nr:hypothetical protein RchiOBHm_Chr2g0175261 [Rosa chinensis]